MLYFNNMFICIKLLSLRTKLYFVTYFPRLLRPRLSAEAVRFRHRGKVSPCRLTHMLPPTWFCLLLYSTAVRLISSIPACQSLNQEGDLVVVGLRAQDSEVSERKRRGGERRRHIWRRTEREARDRAGVEAERQLWEWESERCRKQGDGTRCVWMVMYM